jgi:3-hydroxyisobutyrate dehydrogenase-like beta-hydroxyacid dehydrogenase
MKVAFIGLGHMGAPMSRNILAAGHDLVVHDLRRDAAAGLLAEGAAGPPRSARQQRPACTSHPPR